VACRCPGGEHPAPPRRAAALLPPALRPAGDTKTRTPHYGSLTVSGTGCILNDFYNEQVVARSPAALEAAGLAPAEAHGLAAGVEGMLADPVPPTTPTAAAAGASEHAAAAGARRARGRHFGAARFACIARVVPGQCGAVRDTSPDSVSDQSRGLSEKGRRSSVSAEGRGPSSAEQQAEQRAEPEPEPEPEPEQHAEPEPVAEPEAEPKPAACASAGYRF
jgi:hypothetical protein